MYRGEVKVDGVMPIQEKEIPTQQMVAQELAPLHVEFSASAEHTTRLRTHVDRLKAAGFFFPRSQGGLQAVVERQMHMYIIMIGVFMYVSGVIGLVINYRELLFVFLVRVVNVCHVS